MKLGISEAISLILAIPAHRSQNEGHRKLGEKAIDLLFEYNDSANDKEYNMAMISAVLSTSRLFSVERDRISEKWKVVEYIKQRRVRILELFQNISPFSKGNYWSKILVLLSAGGLSISSIILNGYQNSPSFFVILIFLLFIFELFSKVSEYIFSKWIEERVPTEKLNLWQRESLETYKRFLKFFIYQAIDIHLRYFPDENKLYGYDLNDKNNKKEMINYLIKKQFYGFVIN